MIRFLLIQFLVLFNHHLDSFFKFSALLLKISLGAALLFGGIERKLAAIHCKHLLPNKPHLLTDQENILEQMDSLLVQ